jgi:hypothetical protein
MPRSRAVGRASSLFGASLASVRAMLAESDGVVVD